MTLSYLPQMSLVHVQCVYHVPLLLCFYHANIKYVVINVPRVLNSVPYVELMLNQQYKCSHRNHSSPISLCTWCHYTLHYLSLFFFLFLLSSLSFPLSHYTHIHIILYICWSSLSYRWPTISSHSAHIALTHTRLILFSASSSTSNSMEFLNHSDLRISTSKL